eukprot:260188-Hanusia_phi.AAC.2
MMPWIQIGDSNQKGLPRGERLENPDLCLTSPPPPTHFFIGKCPMTAGVALELIVLPGKEEVAGAAAVEVAGGAEAGEERSGHGSSHSLAYWLLRPELSSLQGRRPLLSD